MSSSTKTAARDREISAAMETHKGRLRNFIAKRIGDQLEAEDVYQDVFEEFVEAYDVGTVFESLGSWLVNVAQNKIFDRFRRKRTQNEHRELILATSEELDPESPSPDEEWFRILIRDSIAEALELLPEDQREVFVKHELEGKTFEEISTESGVSVNTLLARKRYAVLFLRDYLKEIYDELE